jgi:2-succinyl-6-hydroxy-2,4-cyclohexadiene-1-carboxylate synthase
VDKSSSNALYYQIHGDRHRPVITFLHGFLGSHHDFDHLIKPLTLQFCCVTIDLPGHGASLIQTTAQYSMAATAALVIAVLNHAQITQSYLYGYSMGGRLALYLAIYYPQRFPQVMLESASPGLRSAAERLARRQQDDQLADRLEQNWPQFLQDWYDQPLFTSLKQQPQFDQMMWQRSMQNPKFLAQSLRQMGLGTQPNLWPQLAQLQTPIRLLAGSLDRKFVTIQTEIAELCPSASIETVENTGHNIHRENPEVILREIAGFDCDR